jgi:hypothetical protein
MNTGKPRDDKSDKMIKNGEEIRKKKRPSRPK